jgi:hypothetical protein
MISRAIEIRLSCTSTFQAFGQVMPKNTLLAKENHRAEPSQKGNMLCMFSGRNFKVRPYCKNNAKTNAKRAGGMVQVVVHLPSKHKVLSSNPITGH